MISIEEQKESTSKSKEFSPFDDLLENATKAGEKYIKFEIRIVDSGQGISPENLSKLFMNFSKLEEHAAENKRGTGLGLSICKTLIERMGGSVSVESEVGVGTSFIMALQTKCKFKDRKAVAKYLKKKIKESNDWKQFETQPESNSYNMLSSAKSFVPLRRNNTMQKMTPLQMNNRPKLGEKQKTNLKSDQFTFDRGDGRVNSGDQLSSGMSQYLKTPSGIPMHLLQ